MLYGAGHAIEKICGECHRCHCCKASNDLVAYIILTMLERRRCDALCVAMGLNDLTPLRLIYYALKNHTDFLRAAWILLEHILIPAGRRGENWKMHHEPERVKAARCGADGIDDDVLKLRRGKSTIDTQP